MAYSPGKLTQLPNIGKTLSEKLELAGIVTPDELVCTGTETAFLKIKTIDKDACLSTLCAIDGAIQGIRWHNLSAQRKQELKQIFEETEKACNTFS